MCSLWDHCTLQQSSVQCTEGYGNCFILMSYIGVLMEFLLLIAGGLKRNQEIYVIFKKKYVFAVKAPAPKPVSLFSGDLCNKLLYLKPSNEKLLMQAAGVCKLRKGRTPYFAVLNPDI